MKKLILTACLFTFGILNAQVKEYVGKWELSKIVNVKGDTELVKSHDPRYVTYNFEYNNTFSSFIKAKNEEVTGRWGFEFKTKTIKIKNPVLVKAKVAIGDYDHVVYSVTPNYFVEVKTEKKKQFSYYIYNRIR